MDTRHPYPLPDHDGEPVEATQLKLGGTGDTPTPPFPLGRHVVALVEAEVVGTSHLRIAAGQGLSILTRRHLTKAHAVYVVDQAEGRHLLELERQRQHALRATVQVEQQQLPGVTDATTTDRAERLAEQLERAASDHDDAARKLRDRADVLLAQAAAFREEHPEAFVDPDTGEVRGPDRDNPSSKLRRRRT